MINEMLIGCCAGITQVAVGHPLDTMKVLLQNQQSWRGLMLKDYYRGSLAALPSAITKNSIILPVYMLGKKYTDSDIIAGGLAGLAASPTQYIFDFMKIKKQTYQKYEMKDMLSNRGKGATLTRELVGFSLYFKAYYYCKEKGISPVIGGAISGMSLWGLLYPLDTIKTRQISQNISFKDAYVQGKYYNGFGICMTRAVIVNSVLWTMVDFLKKKTNN
jgi:solute carrier family 25 carnitine/acylcarnitine transporter 20/29